MDAKLNGQLRVGGRYLLLRSSGLCSRVQVPRAKVKSRPVDHRRGKKEVLRYHAFKPATILSWQRESDSEIGLDTCEQSERVSGHQTLQVVK